ncbi:hypothetical protein C6T66_07580 [Burkholderia multivorans]|uniref:Uncharacterized protein n=1 Tax=Burkholderia multivorans TaxID=87883 RepID=A0A8E2RW15_9BURK|nr:hypothetical protein C6P76_30035 [Burkholderia multivorans]PRF21910.1 hypothetical protein C6P98_17855 [Burkholderia multivorans]PRG89721.1 hypothetical protein C6T66_07580 [Burkholderia multivorans]
MSYRRPPLSRAQERAGIRLRAQSVLDYNTMRVARIPRLPGDHRAQRHTARRAPSRAARAQAGASGHGCCSSSRGAWCNCINISHATALFTGHVADAIFTALSFARPSRTLPGSNRAFFIGRAAACGGATGPSGERIETGFET